MLAAFHFLTVFRSLKLEEETPMLQLGAGSLGPLTDPTGSDVVRQQFLDGKDGLDEEKHVIFLKQFLEFYEDICSQNIEVVQIP